MSQRSGEIVADYSAIDTPPLQPAAPAYAPPQQQPSAASPYHAPHTPSYAGGPAPVPPSPRGEALRSSILKKPLDATTLGQPSQPGYPPKFR